MGGSYNYTGNRTKGSGWKKAGNAGGKIAAVPLFLLFAFFGEYILLAAIALVLVIIVAIFFIISYPIFQVVELIGLPVELAFILTLIVMECLVIVPVTFLLMRRSLRKKAEREELQRRKAMMEEERRQEETEPVDFMEWFGSWDYSDNEEHLKSMSALRRSSSVTYTAEPESPEDYYMKRWGVDRF